MEIKRKQMLQDRFIWFNGECIRASDAKINVLSPTAQFGANVFEGIRCYWNREEEILYAFRIQDHFRRLTRSLKLFGIDTTFPENRWFDYIRDAIIINNYREDIAVRMTVYIDGDGSWSSTSPSGMFIAPITKARRKHPLDKGISAGISTWRRISDNTVSPRIKAGANYINSRYAQLEARRNGYDTAIFLNGEGRVSEGPGSCIMIIRDGKLITPPSTASTLESITQDTILVLAKEASICTEIRDIDRTELYIADEVFLCGSAAEITPITSVDGHVVSSGSVGCITQRLHNKYIDTVTGKNSEHKEWIKAIW